MNNIKLLSLWITVGFDGGIIPCQVRRFLCSKKRYEKEVDDGGLVHESKSAARLEKACLRLTDV